MTTTQVIQTLRACLALCLSGLLVVGCGDDDGNPAGVSGDAAIDSGGAGGRGGDAALEDGGDNDAQAAGTSGGVGGAGGTAGSAGGPPPCPDADQDGHRAASCGGDDCDDDNAQVHPGMIEICANSVDDDCSYATSDHPDLDGDGFDCVADCNDSVRTINPDRVEVCGNGVDDDCNPATLDLRDLDDDGFSCDVDCDDTNASVHPAADEVCGTGVDEDCDQATSDTGDNDGDGVDCAYDCDDDNANLPDSSHYCVGTLSYFEGFEHGDGGWTVSGVNASWQRGTPAGEHIDRAATGDFAWVTGIDPTGYLADEVSYLTSPSFDFSTLTEDPIFRFARTYQTEADYDAVVVEISVDGGNDWFRPAASSIDQNLYGNTDPGFSGTEPWAMAIMRLGDTAGESDVRIRFALSSDYSLQYEGFALDDVRITEQIVDLSMDAIELPPARCADRTAEAVTVTVSNRSSTTIASFDIAYSINGGTPAIQRITTPLAQDETRELTLTTLANVATPGRHVVRAWVTIPDVNDERRSNDAAEAVTFSFIQAGAPDYSEGFETGGGGWTAMGEFPSWARGTPIGDPINGAGEGRYAWKTNPYGVYNLYENSVLASPCFNFSTLTEDPVLSFLHAYSLYWYDEHTVEVAINGNAFEKLGTTDSLGASHWYNDDDTDAWNEVSGTLGQWRRAHHPLTATAGAAQVQLRFTLTTDGYQYGGVGIDDVRISNDFVDAQISAVDVPTLACAGTTPEIAVTLFNGGNHALSNFGVSYTLDDGTPVVETVAGPIAPLGSTIYTFDAGPLLTAEGTHTLTIRSEAVGQLQSDGSSVMRSIVVQRTLPASGYRESFEEDVAGWRSFGEPLWVRGRASPAASIISTSADGDYAWRTNLRSEYADNSESYLVSPCFDFTAVVSEPEVEFAEIHDTERNYDGVWLEISTDGGDTFTKVGESGVGTNWYNNSSDQWWDGRSAPATWSTARTSLTDVATRPSVLFRFVFTSDGSSTGEGVGIDDFAIVP